MRTILIGLLFLPVTAFAQINRSARELACERAAVYISQKIFPGLVCKTVSFGALYGYQLPDPTVVWVLVHECEVMERAVDIPATPSSKRYRFSIYLDKRMKVIKAESSQVN